MNDVVGIDPGTTHSAVVGFDGTWPTTRLYVPNDDVFFHLDFMCASARKIVIEQVASYGMAVGETTFSTVFWAGRFAQHCEIRGISWAQMKRLAVKMHICHDSRAKDSNIRQALIDRFGRPGSVEVPMVDNSGAPVFFKAGPRKGMQKTEARPNKMAGIYGDMWSALAIAVTYCDLA